jgi:hypothetical protein
MNGCIYEKMDMRICLDKIIFMSGLIIFMVMMFFQTGGGQSGTVNVMYKNFRISYQAEDENLSKIILGSLKSSIPAYESFYNLRLKGTVIIRIPHSRDEYKEGTITPLPEWSNGYYSSQNQSITLKKPGWYMNNDDFGQVLRHELSHVYFQSKFHVADVPLWLNEGLAEYLSGRRIDIEQGVTISNALFANNLVSLSDIDSLNFFNVMRARLAYHESLTAVKFLEKLLKQNEIPWKTFFEWIQREGYKEALKRATTFDIIDFEIAWYRWLKDTYRWFLIFNWENLIWLIIIVILLGSIYAIRYRNQKILKDWETQENTNQELIDSSVLIDSSEKDSGEN